MKKQPMDHASALGNEVGVSLGLTALAVTALLIGPLAHSAVEGQYRPSNVVSFEEIPGSQIKRVILTEKAVERLGIETGEISEAQIVRKQVVGGQVVFPVKISENPQLAQADNSFGAFGREATIEFLPRVVTLTEPDPKKDWIRVTLSEGEWDRMRKNEPARILPLATRPGLKGEVLATPLGASPIADPKRAMLTVYYLVPGKDHGLNLNERVRVEIKLEGNDAKRLIAPYEAVYYDGQGAAWVYVNPKPFVYERQRIEIERVEEGVAVLVSGPPVGTPVVTVGAALLYGAEVIFKR